jgi:hypothetical protein
LKKAAPTEQARAQNSPPTPEKAHPDKPGQDPPLKQNRQPISSDTATKSEPTIQKSKRVDSGETSDTQIISNPNDSELDTEQSKK